MKVLISVFFMSFMGFAAQAEEVPASWESVTQKFSFSSFNSYYSCDYVESLAEQTLEELGATDINVRCRGGLPDWDINWITAEYKVLRTADADKATTVGQVRSRGLKYRESCDLNEAMTSRFLREFEVYHLEKKGICRDSRGRIQYDVQLLGQ